MEEFISSLGKWLQSLVDMLDNVPLFSVFSLFDFLFGAIVLCIVIGIFWKGADS